MRAPVTIGDQVFKTKKAAKEFCRSIRDRYADGVRLNETDAAVIQALLALHPEADEKIGCGVSHFSVQLDSEFHKNRHFVVHRIDGTQTDFSFHVCIDGKKRDADIIQALRTAIADQITEFKSQAFATPPLICPYTKEAVDFSTAHVDHTAPHTFERLVDRWLHSEGLKLSAIEITPSADNQTVARMMDGDQLVSWQRFHRAYAQLRILSQHGHLSHARRAQIR